ncbi:MAG: amidohydrolase family protein, partial [Chitinophagaceae bacterium]
DFNLFPQLGHRKYNNYREWGADIHQQDKKFIDPVQNIPVALRAKWGEYKNLLNGFTTVVNHGDKLDSDNELVTVFQDCYPLHSPGFEQYWKWKLNNPFKSGKPFVMHIGEGTDKVADEEVDEVIRGNWFNKKIIAIHGIPMNRIQAEKFAGLVWCPASNYFLIGKTAAVQQLKEMIPVVFGTDSSLSAPWNAWEQFRECINESAVKETELMDMLTTAPASLWGFDNRGALAAGKRADIVVVKNKQSLFQTNPEDILLVMHKGIVRLYDESIASQLSWLDKSVYSLIKINGVVKFIQGDLPGLMTVIRSHYPEQDFPVSI